MGDAVSASSIPFKICKKVMFLKKLLLVIFILSLSSTVATAAVVNEMAQFRIDTDLTQAGYQTSDAVLNVPASGLVGFAVYVNNVESFRSFEIDITWDAASATSDFSSAEYIEAGDLAINGKDIKVAGEDNILGEPSKVLGELKEDGHYYVNFTSSNANEVSISANSWGLIYFMTLKLSDTAKDLAVTVKSSIGTAEKGGSFIYLGQLQFYVNKEVPVEVKESTWGEIKRKFKDF